MWYSKRDKKRTEEDMPYSEKVERFFKALPGEDLEPPISQDDFSHDVEPPASIYEFPTDHLEYGVPMREPDADVEIAMKFEYQSLIESQAFQWLLTQLQRELHLTTPKPDNLSIIKEQILSVIPTSGKVGSSQPVETCTAVFNVDWDPRAFVKEQQYRERADEAIATAITLTGCPSCAQATTTTEYLDQTWPVSRTGTLQVLKDMVLNGSGHFNACKC
jgi:hypothetical protein